MKRKRCYGNKQHRQVSDTVLSGRSSTSKAVSAERAFENRKQCLPRVVVRGGVDSRGMGTLWSNGTILNLECEVVAMCRYVFVKMHRTVQYKGKM